MKTCLIISKDAGLRKQLARMIEKTGNAYLFESSCTQGIARMLQVKLKFVIVDEAVAHDSIESLIKVMRRVRPQLPVVALLSEDDSVKRERLYDLGVYQCIGKTKSVETLGHQVVSYTSFLMQTASL